MLNIGCFFPILQHTLVVFAIVGRQSESLARSGRRQTSRKLSVVQKLRFAVWGRTASMGENGGGARRKLFSPIYD